MSRNDKKLKRSDSTAVPEHCNPENVLGNDIRWAIREQVEGCLKDPPASFSERIENEVERRVQQRVYYYKIIGLVIVVFTTFFFAVLFDVSQKTIRKTVENQLAEKAVVKAAERILAIQTSAESSTFALSNSLFVVQTNEKEFLDRLTSLRRSDRVVLLDDLMNLFVFQVVTNLVGSNRIRLDHEPLVHSLQIISPAHESPINVDAFGRCEGQTITLNEQGLWYLGHQITNKTVILRYVRKSIR